MKEDKRGVLPMLTRRQLDVLMHLINSTEALSGNSLAQIFHVNVRTIRSDIKKINAFLHPYDMQIKASNQFGYKIEKEDVEKFHKQHILQIIKSDDGFEVPQTPNERISYLFFLLSQGQRYTIEELADLLYISIASIYQDLHVVKKFIDKRFKGIEVSNVDGKLEILGEESAKRNLLSGIVAQRYHHLLEQKYSEYINPSGTFLTHLYDIVELMTIHKHNFDFVMSGESLYSFASDVSLCVEREEQGLLLSYAAIKEDNRFEIIKQFLSGNLPYLQALRKENWWYLQQRFYAKNFLHIPHNAHHPHNNIIIDMFRKEVYQQYQIDILKDEKSCEYAASFLDFYFLNEQQGNYWIEDDKYEIMIQYTVSYALAIYFSYVLYKTCGHILNTTYLAKFALVLEESFLRNEIKLKAVLICNKDKEHISCLLHKLVKHFGNTIDILDYGNLYDARYGHIDVKQYDVVISSEAFDACNPKNYCKISSLCTPKDIAKIHDYVEDRMHGKSPHPYDIEVVHLNHAVDTLPALLQSFEAQHEDIIVVDETIHTWEVEQVFYVRQEENSLLLFTPMWKGKKTCLYQLMLDKRIYYKKHEFVDVKILVVSFDQIQALAQLLPI